MAAVDATAWTEAQAEGLKYSYIATADLAGSATTTYTAVMDFLEYNARSGGVQGVTVTGEATAVSGTDVNIHLFGSFNNNTANAIKLIDSVVTVTNGVKASGTFDLRSYPVPYLWLGVQTDTDESGNDITIYVHYA